MFKYLTTEEAAKKLGITATRVRQLIQESRLPTVQVFPGGPHLIRPIDLRFVAVRKVGRPKKKEESK